MTDGLTLPITGSAILAGVLIWCMKKFGDELLAWFRKVNQHIADCTSKEITEALLAQKVNNIETRMGAVEEKLDRVSQATNENHLEIMQELLDIANQPRRGAR